MLSTPQNLLVSLLHILSLFDYADVAYVSALSQQLLNRIQGIQHSCLRFSYGARKFDHFRVRNLYVVSYTVTLSFMSIIRQPQITKTAYLCLCTTLPNFVLPSPTLLSNTLMISIRSSNSLPSFRIAAAEFIASNDC